MAENPVQRRLAAILAADVVGYSKMMGEDEAGTLAAVRRLRAEVIEPKVAEHQGRLFKSMGDGFLVEFPSVVNSVACATAIQTEMAGRNTDQPQDRHLQLRIGVHLGDVIFEEGDLYGDGVNVAARIEAVAPLGGVAISAMVHDNIRGRIDLNFQDMGEHQLKNIEAPIRLYRLVSLMASARPAERPERTKPSIAVLPLVNLSHTPEHDYFSDGLTEDIITELSRFSSLLVIARNSSFQYKGRSADILQVARELGVQYLVQGTVRRHGTNMRISVQLVEGLSGKQIWAARYDRTVEDLFSVQDEVVRSIVTVTEHRLVENEVALSARRAPSNWVAHDYYLQARAYMNSYDVHARVDELLHKALLIDPNLVEAHAGMARLMLREYWRTLDDSNLRVAELSAKKALAIDNGSATAHSAMSIVCVFQGKLDEGLFHSRCAIDINPYDTLAITDHAQWLVYAGKNDEALQNLDTLLTRDPVPPTWYWDTRAAALFQHKRYQDAINSYLMVQNHQIWELSYLAACSAYLDRMMDARHYSDAMLAIDPDVTAQKMLRYERYRDPESKSHYLYGLRLAGLPQGDLSDSPVGYAL